MALRSFPPGQTPCAFRLGELSRSAWSLTSPVGHTVQPRGFHLPRPSPTSPPKECRQGRGRTSVPYHPGLVPRSPVRAHGFSAQNAFDQLDPISSGEGVCRAVKLSDESEPTNWSTLAARLSSPPVKVMGRLLELDSTLPPSSTVLTPLRKVTRVRQDASHRSLQPTYCQRAPLKPTNSRARGSHLPDRLFPPRPSPSTLVLSSDRRRRRGHRIARRHLRSRVMQRLVPLHQP